MSIYNGFGTRQQESTYTKALYNTVFLLQLRICKLFKGEKFDDIKFGKVLTKLYARMFSMEQFKYLPPKYSYALKDIAEFLGIFEITEDQIKQRRGEISETSSNLSYMTSSAFKPKLAQLDVIRESNHQKEEENDLEEEGGAAIGERVKTGSKKMFQGSIGGRQSIDSNSNSVGLQQIQQYQNSSIQNQPTLSSRNSKAHRNKSSKSLNKNIDEQPLNQSKVYQRQIQRPSIQQDQSRHMKIQQQEPITLRKKQELNSNRTTINNNIIININNPSASVPIAKKRRPSFSSERGFPVSANREAHNMSAQMTTEKAKMRKTDSEFTNAIIPEPQIKLPRMAAQQQIPARSLNMQKNSVSHVYQSADVRRKQNQGQILSHNNNVRLGSQGGVEYEDTTNYADAMSINAEVEDGHAPSQQHSQTPNNQTLRDFVLNNSNVGSPIVQKSEDIHTNQSFEAKYKQNNSMVQIYQQRQVRKPAANQHRRKQSDVNSFNSSYGGSLVTRDNQQLLAPGSQYGGSYQVGKFIGKSGGKFVNQR